MENRPVFISFIIPVYNSERYIARCIKSIEQQSVSDYEIILIDDGSTDSSAKICKALSSKNPRIKYYYQKNAGQGNARNQGIEKTAGEWITFVDNDDWLDKDCISEVFPLMTDDVDIIMFCKNDIRGGKRIPYKLNTARESLVIEENNIRQVIFATLNYYYGDLIRFGILQPGTPWAKFYRRSVILNNNVRFVESYGEDRPFTIRAYLSARKIVVLNKALYNYRVHKSAMRRYLPNAIEKYEPSRAEIHSIIQEAFGEEPDASEQLNHLDLAWFSYCCMQDYFHLDNKESYFSRKNRFLTDRKAHAYKEPLDLVNVKCLPLRRRVLAILIKRERFFLIALLYRMNQLYESLQQR